MNTIVLKFTKAAMSRGLISYSLKLIAIFNLISSTEYVLQLQYMGVGLDIQISVRYQNNFIFLWRSLYYNPVPNYSNNFKN